MGVTHAMQSKEPPECPETFILSVNRKNLIIPLSSLSPLLLTLDHLVIIRRQKKKKKMDTNRRASQSKMRLKKRPDSIYSFTLLTVSFSLNHSNERTTQISIEMRSLSQ